MPGTPTGGQRAAQTNKELYGEDFYVKIGSKGGKISKGGHFADTTVGRDGLTNAQRAGQKGGKRSRKLSTSEHIAVLKKEVEKDQKFWREVRMK